MPTFPTPEPITATVELTGDVRVTASDRTDTHVEVRPRNPDKAADIRAAEQTVIECADGRLLVKAPRHWRQFTPWGGHEAIEVTIELPTGSEVVGESAMGHLTADGELGACRFKTGMGSIRLDQTGALLATTGMGDVTVDRVTGDAEVKTGSGDVRVDEIDGAAVIRNANGATDLGAVDGDLRIKASNGDITIGRAGASVTAKTANGDVRVAEVSTGTVVLETAAGEVEVGIRRGTAAWLDVNTRFGMVRNQLDTSDGPTTTDRTVEVRARTSVGDIVIARAAGGTDDHDHEGSNEP